MKVKVPLISASIALGLLSTLGEGQVSYPTLSTHLANPSIHTNIISNLRAIRNGIPQTPLASFTLWPSTYSGTPGYPNPTYAYDDNFTTASSVSLTQLGKGANARLEDWFGFPAAPSGATGLTLNINSSAVTGTGGDAIIYYSLDGGATFTTVYNLLSNHSRAQQTDVITLSDSQDLTQVRVRAQAGAVVISPGGESTASQSVYEIWISGND